MSLVDQSRRIDNIRDESGARQIPDDLLHCRELAREAKSENLDHFQREEVR